MGVVIGFDGCQCLAEGRLGGGGYTEQERAKIERERGGQEILKLRELKNIWHRQLPPPPSPRDVIGSPLPPPNLLIPERKGLLTVSEKICQYPPSKFARFDGELRLKKKRVRFLVGVNANTPG